MCDKCQELQKKLTALESERDQLTAALEPFAMIAKAYDKLPDAVFVIQKSVWIPSKGTTDYCLSVGNLNRARQVLVEVGKANG